MDEILGFVSFFCYSALRYFSFLPIFSISYDFFVKVCNSFVVGILVEGIYFRDFGLLSCAICPHLISRRCCWLHDGSAL